MKGFGALVKNENIKILRQTSFVVLTIIFAAMLVLVPFGGWVIDQFESSSFSVIDAESYKEWADEMRANGDEAEALYYEARYDSLMAFANADISTSSVEYRLYGNQLNEYYSSKAAIDAYIGGKITEDALRYSSIWFSLNDYLQMNFSRFGLTEEDMFSEEHKDGGLYSILTSDIAAKIAAGLDADIKAVIANITDFDIKPYYKGLVDSQKGYVEREEEDIADTNTNLADPKLSDEDRALMTYNLEVAKLRLEGQRAMLAGYEHLFENACDYNGWEFRTVTNLLNSATGDLSSCVPVSEETFRGDLMYNYGFKTYADYVKSCETKLATTREAVTLSLYSLEHSTPIPETMPVSAKLTWKNQLSSMITFATVILIVLAGTTLAHEYTSGTIRLLLIRPKKRSKILASKLASAGLYWGMLILGATLVLFLINLICYGAGDLFVPDLVCNGAKVTEIPSFISALGAVLLDMIPPTFFILLALLLSVLVKKAALSIALPLIGLLFSGTAQLLSVVLVTEAQIKFIKYTPFPYLDLSVFNTSAAASYSMDFDIMNLGAMLFTPETLAKLNVNIGFIYFALFIGLEIFFTFFAFTRQQIKN